MRKIKLMLVSLVAVSMLYSCQSSTDDNNSVNTSGSVSGKWLVTSYTDRSKNETSNYSAFTFEFLPANVLSVVGNNASYSGSWQTGNDDSKQKLTISFASPALLVEISEDWEIITMNSVKIDLYHKSGGDGHESFLTFEKK